MAGRKPKLTKELVQRAIQLKKGGANDKDICIACDISTAAFYRWQEEGGKTELQKELVEGLKKAEADYKNALLKEIKNFGGAKDWKALAWLLERKYPHEFGRVDRLQAEVKQETQAKVEYVHYFSYEEDTDGVQE